MENLLIVPKTGLKAIAFVFRKFRFFVLRVLPAFVAIGLIELLPYYLHNLPVEIGHVYWALKNLIYGAFIVSWHRYTMLPSERRRSGLVLSYGLREIKIGVILVAVVYLEGRGYQLLQYLMPGRPNVPVYSSYAYIFFLLSTLLLFFVYPSIAVDQPIRLKLFWSKAFRLFFSFILASPIAIAVLILGNALQLGFHHLYGSNVANNIWSIMPVLMVSHFITFLKLAFLASTASFLYRDVIGLKGGTAAGSPPSA